MTGKSAVLSLACKSLYPTRVYRIIFVSYIVVMKKIFLLGFAVFFLASCFGNWGWSSDQTALVDIEREGFQVSMPTNWQEVYDYELTSPSQGEVVLAYRAQEARSGYYNNLVILKNQNRLQETDLALMNNNINTLKLSMQSFEMISRDTLTFTSNDSGEVIVFQGRYSQQTPDLFYIQSAKSCGDESYFLTISVGSELGDYTRYYPLLESFRCN